jgi:alpha-L-rhamnosidase
VKNYVDTNGIIGLDIAGDTQGSYALALQFGLLDEPQRSKAAHRLDELTVANGHHPTTGFWSSIELLLALSESGYNGEAALMLNQREMPSWGYMADHGTTMWEAFNADSRNLSRDHWTHSAINEWLWRNVTGLNPDEDHPGYRSFSIQPRPTKEVSWCRASYNSISGQIVSNWKRVGNTFTLEVIVPINTTAIVTVPAAKLGAVNESGKPVAEANGVTFLRYESGAAVYRLGSGPYHFDSVVDPENFN